MHSWIDSEFGVCILKLFAYFILRMYFSQSSSQYIRYSTYDLLFPKPKLTKSTSFSLPKPTNLVLISYKGKTQDFVPQSVVGLLRVSSSFSLLVLNKNTNHQRFLNAYSFDYLFTGLKKHTKTYKNLSAFYPCALYSYL